MSFFYLYKKKLKMYLSLLILYFPVLLISPIRKLIPKFLLNHPIEPFAFILLIIFPILVLFMILPSYKKLKMKYVFKFTIAIILLLIIIFFQFLTIEEKYKISFPIILNIMIPLFLGFFLNCYLYDLNSIEIYRNYLLIFITYLMINIFVWLFYLMKKLPQSSGLNFVRMGGTLAPSVLLGQLILIIFSLFYFIVYDKYRTKKNKKNIFFCILIFLISSYLTGSRSSFWGITIFLFLWLLIFIEKKNKIKFYLFFGYILFLGIIYFSHIKAGRLFNYYSEGRFISIKAGLNYFSQSPLNKKLIGHGFGLVYPYEKWKLEGGRIWNNTFYLGENLSIIHPHNSFLWILIEGGMIFFFIFSYVIFIGLKKIIFNQMYYKQKGILFLIYFSFIITLFVTSGILHTPSFSINYWFLFFLFIRILEENNIISASGKEDILIRPKYYQVL